MTQGCDFGSMLGIPDPDYIASHCHQLLAIWAESCASHGIPIAIQAYDLASTLGIPDLRPTITCHGHQALAIREECHASHVIYMAQDRYLVTVLDVPDPHRAIIRHSHSLVAIWAERGAQHQISMAFEHMAEARRQRSTCELTLDFGRVRCEPWNASRGRICLQSVAHGAIKLFILECTCCRAGVDGLFTSGRFVLRDQSVGCNTEY
jgi:hypothetical protein